MAVLKPDIDQARELADFLCERGKWFSVGNSHRIWHKPDGDEWREMRSNTDVQALINCVYEKPAPRFHLHTEFWAEVHRRGWDLNVLYGDSSEVRWIYEKAEDKKRLRALTERNLERSSELPFMVKRQEEAQFRVNKRQVKGWERQSKGQKPDYVRAHELVDSLYERGEWFSVGYNSNRTIWHKPDGGEWREMRGNADMRAFIRDVYEMSAPRYNLHSEFWAEIQRRGWDLNVLDDSDDFPDFPEATYANIEVEEHVEALYAYAHSALIGVKELLGTLAHAGDKKLLETIAIAQVKDLLQDKELLQVCINAETEDEEFLEILSAHIPLPLTLGEMDLIHVCLLETLTEYNALRRWPWLREKDLMGQDLIHAVVTSIRHKLPIE